MLGRSPLDICEQIMEVYQAMRNLCGYISVYGDEVRNFFRQLDLVRRTGQDTQWRLKAAREDALRTGTEATNGQTDEIDGAIAVLLPRRKKEIEALSPGHAN
jgi:hypothetical protein